LQLLFLTLSPPREISRTAVNQLALPYDLEQITHNLSWFVLFNNKMQKYIDDLLALFYNLRLLNFAVKHSLSFPLPAPKFSTFIS
jgi:hypothetical protein